MSPKDDWYLPPHLRALQFGITILATAILIAINQNLFILALPIHILGAVIIQSRYRRHQKDVNATFYEKDRLHSIGPMLELIEDSNDDTLRKRAIRRLSHSLRILGPEHCALFSPRQRSLLLRKMHEYRASFPLFTIAALTALENMKDIHTIDAVKDLLREDPYDRPVQKSVREAAERCILELERQRDLSVQRGSLLRSAEAPAGAGAELLIPARSGLQQDETLLLRPKSGCEPTAE